MSRPECLRDGEKVVQLSPQPQRCWGRRFSGVLWADLQQMAADVQDAKHICVQKISTSCLNYIWTGLTAQEMSVDVHLKDQSTPILWTKVWQELKHPSADKNCTQMGFTMTARSIRPSESRKPTRLIRCKTPWSYICCLDGHNLNSMHADRHVCIFWKRECREKHLINYSSRVYEGGNSTGRRNRAKIWVMTNVCVTRPKKEQT